MCPVIRSDAQLFWRVPHVNLQRAVPWAPASARLRGELWDSFSLTFMKDRSQAWRRWGRYKSSYEFLLGHDLPCDLDPVVDHQTCDVSGMIC